MYLKKVISRKTCLKEISSLLASLRSMTKIAGSGSVSGSGSTPKCHGSGTLMMALCSDSGNRLWRSMLNLLRRRASRWSTPASRTGSTTSGAARKREIHILAPPQIPGDEINQVRSVLTFWSKVFLYRCRRLPRCSTKLTVFIRIRPRLHAETVHES
jgi:hypothetical protein